MKKAIAAALACATILVAQESPEPPTVVLEFWSVQQRIGEVPWKTVGRNHDTFESAGLFAQELAKQHRGVRDIQFGPETRRLQYRVIKRTDTLIATY
jgi:hypothetical protein